MRKTLRISLLTLALCCPVLAGEIHNPAPQPPPPPPPTTNVVQEPEGGEIHNPQAAEDTVIQVALTLLQSVLSAF